MSAYENVTAYHLDAFWKLKVLPQLANPFSMFGIEFIP